MEILFGIPATNKKLSMKGISIWRLRDGIIAEHWVQSDMVAMTAQLGAISSP